MSPSTPRAMIRALTDMYCTMERENWALREHLHTLGLSDEEIQQKVVEYLNSEDYRPGSALGPPMRLGCPTTALETSRR